MNEVEAGDSLNAGRLSHTSVWLGSTLRKQLRARRQVGGTQIAQIS